jgi:hypothetical protein
MENFDVVTVGAIVIVVMLASAALLMLRARRVNLIHTSAGQKPEWLHTMPPPETIAATQADGEGITLYDYDKGEKEAAPFAEQIEDILRAQLKAEPDLRSSDIDLGTAPDGGLEIRVGDKSYTSIEQIPNERIRVAIGQAVATYNQRYQDERPIQ